MLHDIRAFFIARKVLEVETPALSQAGNTDPFIESFQINNTSNLHNDRYLHTSPEYPMKRLLADGSGDIYQICKVWRKGEAGSNHNPEFTMLEWYRVDFSYPQLMEEVAQLLKMLLPNINKQHNIHTYQQLFINTFGINPHIENSDALSRCVKKNIKGLDTTNLNQQAMLDALLTHCIEPDFNKDALTFIIDYPENQSALAQLRSEENYKVAERFEVYLGKQELGNGYQEEIDFKRNQGILSTETNQRLQMQLTSIPQDQNFLDAAQAGIPKTSGVALGIDRILMCRTNSSRIKDVINFPWEVA